MKNIQFARFGIPIILMSTLLGACSTPTPTIDDETKISTVESYDKKLDLQYAGLLDAHYSVGYSEYDLAELKSLRDSTTYIDAQKYRAKLIEIQDILRHNDSEWYNDATALKNAKLSVQDALKGHTLSLKINAPEPMENLYGEYVTLLQEEYNSLYDKRTKAYTKKSEERSLKLDSIENLINRSDLISETYETKSDLTAAYEKRIYMDTVYTQDTRRDKSDLISMLKMPNNKLKKDIKTLETYEKSFTEAQRNAKMITFETKAVENYRNQMVENMGAILLDLTVLQKELSQKKLDNGKIDTLKENLAKTIANAH